MTHRCRDCNTGKSRAMFTLKMGTVMESSKLPYRVWAIGIYLFATSLKGVSSMKLHRELGITQKAAWCMLHRLRKTKASGAGWFSGPVEVDETHMGGKRASMSNAKRRELADEGASRGAAGKVAVVGAQDRATKQVSRPRSSRTPTNPRYRASSSTAPSRMRRSALTRRQPAKVSRWRTLRSSTASRSSSGDSRGQVHTSSMESFRSLFKRGYVGVCHKMSPKRLDRYVTEFQGRHNVRESDTIDQMGGVVEDMGGKRLRYRDLVKPHGLPSGARGGRWPRRSRLSAVARTGGHRVRSDSCRNSRSRGQPRAGGEQSSRSRWMCRSSRRSAVHLRHHRRI